MSLNKMLRRLAASMRYCLNYHVRGITVSRPPIFIVGCGHSGTTLLLAILGAHSRIYAHPHESSVGFSDDAGSMLADFARNAIAVGKVRWVEKTPRHIKCIGRLLDLCPDAQVLLIIRDGRDVACSIKERLGDIEEGIKRWIESNRMGEEYHHHPNVHVLRYEDLIEDFDATMSAVMDFLGEDYEPQMREYYRSGGRPYTRKIKRRPSPSGEHHRRYRQWQVTQPLFDGRGKWKSMTEDEKRIVKEHANEMLIRYGYADSEDW